MTGIPDMTLNGMLVCAGCAKVAEGRRTAKKRAGNKYD
jgi:hypothetical protein